MKAKTIVINLSIALCTSSMAAAYLYDFSTASGSGFPGTEINSNDNWEYLAGDGVTVYTQGSNTAYQTDSVYDGAQIWRQNNSNFSYILGVTDNTIILSFEARTRNTSYALFALGYDDGSTVTVGPQFGLSTTNWLVREADFGTNNTVPNGLTGDTKIYKFQLEVDVAANSGNGSGSLSVQNLTDGGVMTAIDGLQNVNLALGSMGISNLSSLNGLFVRLENPGSWVDNLAVSSIPEPSAMILLGLTGTAALIRRRK